MTAQTPAPRTDCLENLSSPPPLILILERVIVKDISEIKNQRRLPFGNLMRLFTSKISPARKNHLPQILHPWLGLRKERHQSHCMLCLVMRKSLLSVHVWVYWAFCPFYCCSSSWLSPFYSWENRGFKKLRSLPKGSQLLKDRTRIWQRALM